MGWRNSEDRVRENFIFQKPFTVQGHIEWMETKVASGKLFSSFCVKQKGTGRGSVYFRDIDRENNRAEYGIFIGEEDAAGKGYGTLAAKGAVCYASR